MVSPHPSSSTSSYFTSFLTSSIACIFANLVTHPLETIKTRQQLVSSSKTISVTSITKQIVKNEGFNGLYKGLNASLLRAVISGAGRLTTFEFLKENCTRYGLLSKKHSNQPTELPLRAGLAVSSGSFAALLSSPIDMVRTKQAADASNKNLSVFQILLNVLRKDRIHGLFAGSNALMLRAATFNLGQLMSYDYFKCYTMEYFDLPSTHVTTHVLASLGAGLIASTISIGIENIKTVQQVGSPSGSLSIFGVTRDLYRIGGIMQFFRGWSTLWAKVGPHTFIVFVTAEFLREKANIEGF